MRRCRARWARPPSSSEHSSGAAATSGRGGQQQLLSRQLGWVCVQRMDHSSAHGPHTALHSTRSRARLPPPPTRPHAPADRLHPLPRPPIPTPQPTPRSYLDGSRRYALYRLPTSGTPRGTCILVHGCKHDPESWFYKSAACPKCTGAQCTGLGEGEAGGRARRALALGCLASVRRTAAPSPPPGDHRANRCAACCLPRSRPPAGLPEEVAHTKQCLARGYAVLALMSKDRQYKSRCFSSSTDSAWQKGAAATGSPPAAASCCGRRERRGHAGLPACLHGCCPPPACLHGCLPAAQHRLASTPASLMLPSSPRGCRRRPPQRQGGDGGLAAPLQAERQAQVRVWRVGGRLVRPQVCAHHQAGRRGQR